MKREFLHKITFALITLLLIPLLTYAQPTIIAVGSSADVNTVTADSALLASLQQYCFVTYTDQKSFDSKVVNGEELVYDAYDGVVFFESCNSSSSPNFAIDEYPIPCITMEAGFLSKWGLLDPDFGGIWPYVTPEAIDLDWKVAQADHPITYFAGDRTYQDGDIITWSDNPDPSIYGIPYVHDILDNVDIVLTAARTEGEYEDGTFDDESVKDFDQDEAIALCILPTYNILYLCASMDQIAKDGVVYATEDFWKILEKSVIYMTEGLDDPSGINIIENSSLDVYPNPARGIVNFNMDVKGLTNATISLINVAGERVLTTELNALDGNSTFRLKVESVASGVYMMKVEAGKHIGYKKIIIE